VGAFGAAILMSDRTRVSDFVLTFHVSREKRKNRQNCQVNFNNGHREIEVTSVKISFRLRTITREDSPTFEGTHVSVTVLKWINCFLENLYIYIYIYIYI
jgi:hypothetical protein